MTDAPEEKGRWRTLFSREGVVAAWRRLSSAVRGFLSTKEGIAALITAFATILVGLATILAGFLPTLYMDKEVEYAGQVVNGKGNPISGATVSIRDEQGNIQVKITDSVGRYQYFMKPSTKSAHFTVTADMHVPYKRDLPPNQTGREPFILTSVQPTPNPIATTEPSPSVKRTPASGGRSKSVPRVNPTPRPTPCSAEGRLLGKC